MTNARANVLIVEDDIRLSHDWATALRVQGYEVEQFDGVEAAVHHCIRNWPDIVVLDGYFKEPSGELKRIGAATFCADLLKFARKFERPMPPVIGVTGMAKTKYMPHHIFDAISGHVMPIALKKPFAPRKLIRTIEQMLYGVSVMEPMREAMPMQ